jgi:uncharacterized protein (UPF0548 family)
LIAHTKPVAVDQTQPVALRLKRPSSDDLRPLLEAGRAAELTYAPVGITAGGDLPAGYKRQRFERVLEAGDDAFDAGRDALHTWQVQRRSGLVVCDEGPPRGGDVVAMSGPLPLGYIDVVCRIIKVVDETDKFGFAYGTLPVHVADGEESFTIGRDHRGTATFVIDVVSRPRHPLARLCPPITRRLQRRAIAAYLDAMSQAVRGR